LKARGVEDLAPFVDDRDDMDVFVGVHTAGDNSIGFCHTDTCLPWLFVGGMAPPAGTADRTLTVLIKAPIRSHPSNRLVRVPGQKARSTDLDQGTKPVRRWVRPSYCSGDSSSMRVRRAPGPTGDALVGGPRFILQPRPAQPLARFSTAWK